jgi:hypothetical protein
MAIYEDSQNPPLAQGCQMVYFHTKTQFGFILEGRGMENVGMYSGHLQYIKAFGHIFRPLGHFVVIWYIFSRFGTLCHDKSGNPALATATKKLNPGSDAKKTIGAPVSKIGHGRIEMWTML